MNNLKLITATALVALCATSAAAHYVYSADMVSCQAIESDVQRLSCYDDMDLSGTDEAPASEAPPWQELSRKFLRQTRHAGRLPNEMIPLRVKKPQVYERPEPVQFKVRTTRHLH